MSRPHVCNIKEIFLQLDDPLRFRFIRIKGIEDISITQINEREKMSKKFNK